MYSSVSKEWPIELQDNYFHSDEQYLVCIGIDPIQKKIIILDFEAIPGGEYKKSLIRNGLHI